VAISQFNHIAYRCSDAAVTTRFYEDVIGLPLAWAVTSDTVGSTGQHDPHIHIFFALPDGTFLAFFELLDRPPAQKDPNTPEWVQHISFTVSGEQELVEAKARLEKRGIKVLGPKNGHRFNSIYFFDPNGHRLEYTYCKQPMGPQDAKEAREIVASWQKRVAAKPVKVTP
jgi:catechol 2,3-dioxygenase-like lactoylglutathione lyase family enzyme